ncbi:MAG: hypothetical protein AB8B73_04200 [Ekhidna sp.]
MKRIVKISCLFFLVALSSCFEKEVFPDEPKIEFENLVFKDTNDSDTLVLSFSFENGGGDFWVDSDQDIFPPYNEFNFFIDDNNELVTADNYDAATLPIFKVPVLLRNYVATRVVGNDIFFTEEGNSFVIFGFNKDTLKSLDELPPLECPFIANENGAFNSINFKIFDYIDNELLSADVSVVDDIIVERVETHYNLLIRFEENINGEFVPVNYEEEFENATCDDGIWNARVPLFEENSTVGVIDYKIVSRGFVAAFADSEIRIIISIIDRNFNKSNEISFDFFLSEITQ